MFQIAVENIKCGGCINSIQKALLLIDKVEKVTINQESGIVIVSGEADRSAIVARLTQLGYPETGLNTVLCKAKSYVSCAIGRIT